MVVVHGHELVILAAGDLVGDLLTVDDGRHAVFHVTAGLLSLIPDGLHTDVADADLAPVSAFTEPALPRLHVVEGLAPDPSDAATLVLLLLEDRLLHHQVRHVLGDDRLRMEAALLLPDLLQGGRGELEAYRLPALQHLHRDLSLPVLADDTVDDVEPRGDGDVLEGFGGEDRHLILPQVIDKVAVDGGGLHRKRTGPLVHDDAVAGEDLVPLFLGEIHVGGDELGVGLRLLAGGRTRLDLGDDGPEFRQHVLSRTDCGLRLRSLVSLVVETVAAVLEFARLHPSVGTVGDKGSPAVAEFPAHAAQVEAFLAARCPAEHASAGPEVHERTCDPAVFALTDPVAVKAHHDAPVGVACMDIVLRHVEILPHDGREGIVGLAVRGVRAPVRKGGQVLTRKGIGEKRGVVALYGEQHAVAALDETCLHAVAPECVLQLRSEAGIAAQCSGSGRHRIIF